MNESTSEYCIQHIVISNAIRYDPNQIVIYESLARFYSLSTIFTTTNAIMLMSQVTHQVLEFLKQMRMLPFIIVHNFKCILPKKKCSAKISYHFSFLLGFPMTMSVCHCFLKCILLIFFAIDLVHRPQTHNITRRVMRLSFVDCFLFV